MPTGLIASAIGGFGIGLTEFLIAGLLPQVASSFAVSEAAAGRLISAERERLKKMAYGHKTGHQARQRATVVLLAARGRGNVRIAAETRLHVDTVRT
jgi:DNA-binding NarL/FixJ family response regulator